MAVCLYEDGYEPYVAKRTGIGQDTSDHINYLTPVLESYFHRVRCVCGCV